MKKTVSFLLTVLLLAALLPVASAEEITLPVHAEGSIFGGSGKDSVALELRFDPAWLTEGDGTVYDKDLAAFCAVVSDDVYFRQKDLDRGTPNRVLVDGTDPAAYDQTALLTAAGFTDVQYIESFRAGTYETDANDSVTMTLGYYTDGANDCFIIVIRGCFSIGEWSSTFDPGADTRAYAALTGAHPDWTDTRVLKGIGIAVNRSWTFIEAYMAAHDDPARPNCVLVTGHSRGGAVAECIGARFEDDPAVKCVTYAFNSMPVTTDPAAEAYETVFNIFDGADFFSACLPFAEEPLYRYGRTLSVPVADRPEIRAAIAAVKGADDYLSLSPDTAEAYRACFARLFPDRASLYEPRELTRSYTSEAEAEAARENSLALISAETGLGLEAYCSVSAVEPAADGGVMFRITYCRAALLQCLARTLAYGQSACDAVCALFAEEADFCAMLGLLLANGASLTAGHRLLNSYVLTGFAA